MYRFLIMNFFIIHVLHDIPNQGPKHYLYIYVQCTSACIHTVIDSCFPAKSMHVYCFDYNPNTAFWITSNLSSLSFSSFAISSSDFSLSVACVTRDRCLILSIIIHKVKVPKPLMLLDNCEVKSKRYINKTYLALHFKLEFPYCNIKVICFTSGIIL